MIINDDVFGELEYNYAWAKYTTIDFYGKEFEIALMVSGEEDGKFDEEQYEAYRWLMKNWKSVQEGLLRTILNYYKETRHELGYDVVFDENYPLIETTAQLFDRIKLVGINIPYARNLKGRCIGLMFDCTWDEENGVGILLIDEKINEIGYQDVAI